MKRSLKNRFGNNHGFTIMEIVVVIFIIVFGLLGITSLVNQNIQTEYTNKNTIIASELAREGLELIRNKRDNNWIAKEDWKYSSTTGSNFDIIQDGSYTVDYTGAISAAANSLSDNVTKLYLNDQGFYTHTPAPTSTVFSRLITVDYENPGSTMIFVTCKVRWQRGTAFHDLAVSTLFYDWR